MHTILLTEEQERLLQSIANMDTDGNKKVYFIPYVFLKNDNMKPGQYGVIRVNEHDCRIPGFAQYKNQYDDSVVILSK